MVPAAMVRSQLVVQVNAIQVNVLEDDRWASPLADEIRNAMLAAVSRQSGAVDVHEMARADNVAVYNVSVDVRRFESWPGSHVLIDVVWTVRPSNSQETMTCHSVVSRSVSAGYDAGGARTVRVGSSRANFARLDARHSRGRAAPRPRNRLMDKANRIAPLLIGPGR
jgi:uncharacterized lipoprotein YmbA